MHGAPVIVALATAWGPRYGGINTFNTELLRSLGILPGRAFDLLCVVPTADEEDVKDAARYRIELLSVQNGATEFYGDAANRAATAIGQRAQAKCCIWLGHDDKTGPLALEMRKRYPGSRAILFHHMAHGAYQSVKKGSSGAAARKREHQRALFSEADLCLAVGPMLRSQLEDLLDATPRSPPVVMVVPGLADSQELDASIRDQPPGNFTAFVAGRLSAEDDRIKQGRLAVRGFGVAIKTAFESLVHRDNAMRRSPTLRMRGVRGDEEDEMRSLLRESSGRELNCDILDYTEDRQSYIRDLASSSVALMPSWHEGFGLVAWEAIACAVPVVIGEQSGVFRLLNDECQGAGLGKSVRHVAVEGHVGTLAEEPNHTDSDVNKVADELYGLGARIDGAKVCALGLRRQLLRLGFHWKGTAQTLTDSIASFLGCSLLVDARAPSSTETPVQAHPVPMPTQALPAFLRPPTPRPWRRDVGLAPSALLNARDQIAAFDAEREPVVQGLQAGVTELDQRFSVHLIHGPGGIGKTRLALEIMRRLPADDWHHLWLATELPVGWGTEFAGWLFEHCCRPTLLTVDYAEVRQEDVLSLLKTALDFIRRPGAPPLRVLLLARTSDWWTDLPRHPACEGDLVALLTGAGVTGVTGLRGWSRDPAIRLRTYRAALEDYATAMEQRIPAHIYVPDLQGPTFARPLYLHLAALATLEGQRPSHVATLLESQLLRDWRYWVKCNGPEVCTYDEWADALAWIALAQGATLEQARVALADLGLLKQRLLQALAATYPDDDAIAALQPDPLAYALIRERIADARGTRLLNLAFSTNGKNATSFLALLARVAAQVTPAAGELARWEAVLVKALARRWSALGQSLIHAAHVAEPGLGHLLYKAWNELPKRTQFKLAPVLDTPFYSSNLLDLCTAVDRTRLELASTSAERASCLSSLANRLSDQGGAASHAEALVCARESVKIRRVLAEALPTVHMPDLAGSLNNLANRLSAQGDAISRAEALGRAREAVQIYHQLAQAQPAVFLPDLALSLNTLAIRLTEQGDDAVLRAEALACARESVMIRSELVRTQPEAHALGLAKSLHTFAVRLSEKGDAGSRAESVVYARESVKLRRMLAEAQPAACLPDLALSLNSLAIHLSEQGDATLLPEALTCARESVQLYRQLTQAHPSAYLSDLALSLDMLAVRLSAKGAKASRAEALACAREAVQIYRQLAQAQPAVHMSDVGMSLNNLANHLYAHADAPSLAEALACAREAVQILALCHIQAPKVHQYKFELSKQQLMRIAHKAGIDPQSEVAGTLGKVGIPTQGCSDLKGK